MNYSLTAVTPSRSLNPLPGNPKQLPRSRVSEEVGGFVRKPELEIVPGDDEKIEPASLYWLRRFRKFGLSLGFRDSLERAGLDSGWPHHP